MAPDLSYQDKIYEKMLLEALEPSMLFCHFGGPPIEKLSVWGRILVFLKLKKAPEQHVKPLPTSSGDKITFKRYQPLPLSNKPIMDGRVPTPWLVRNMCNISKEDFYDQKLTEKALKEKYSDLK